MKHNVILVITIFIICITVVLFKYLNYKKEFVDVSKYNQTYLEYNRNNLYGTDITTVINKATNNNEINKIKKDKFDQYISDESNSIKIYIKFEKDGEEYPMEKINKAGIQDFTSYFGEIVFMCKKIEYHKNGKISEMHFEATNY